MFCFFDDMNMRYCLCCASDNSRNGCRIRIQQLTVIGDNKIGMLNYLNHSTGSSTIKPESEAENLSDNSSVQSAPL
jgi:hypothetical protein